MAKKKKAHRSKPKPKPTRSDVSASVLVAIQMCEDAALMAANDVFHCGPKRAEPFCLAMGQYLNTMMKMVADDTKDLEYSKTIVDERLVKIVGQEKMRWWDQRYT